MLRLNLPVIYFFLQLVQLGKLREEIDHAGIRLADLRCTPMLQQSHQGAYYEHMCVA